MSVRRAVLDLLTLLLLVCTTGTRAGLVNISIDDTYGDLTTGLKPIYQPSGSTWYGQGCSGSSCGTIVPSPYSAFDQTWTAASYTSSLNNMSITLSFTGSKISPLSDLFLVYLNIPGVSVWVFFILANNVNVYGTNATTMCNVTIDGNSMVAVSHQPSTSSAFQYNSTVFSTSGLSNSQHELVISTDVSPSFICFDYAIYTYVFFIIVSTAAESHVITGPMFLIARLFQTLDLPPPGSLVPVAPQNPQQPILHHRTASWVLSSDPYSEVSRSLRWSSSWYSSDV